MADSLFYVFAFFSVLCAVGVVLNKNAVNAAFCLLLSLGGIAGLFVLLDAFLLAFLLILVYAGAVVALFLFIIMLLDMQKGAQKPFKKATIVASVAAFGIMIAGLASLAQRGGITGAAAPVDTAGAPVGSVLKHYAEMLFTTYLLPVQVVGFLLLIAMLGVIVLSKKFDGLEDIK